MMRACAGDRIPLHEVKGLRCVGDLLDASDAQGISGLLRVLKGH